MILRRVLPLLAALAAPCALPAAAQTPAAPPASEQAATEGPRIETEFETSETVPGRFLTLRVTVLVPTYLPKPIDFPSMEAPDLRVRLPERSTGPVSRRIGGASWSGVSRRWLISPLAPGRYTIPAQEVSVTWSPPEGGDPRTTILRTDPVTFSGVLPEGAEDLDPFIAAEALSLGQEVSGSGENLKPGDAVTRTLTATIEGVSPFVLPPMLTGEPPEGLAAYPDPPEVTETETRGELAGTRRESVTLMAQSGGAGELPAVTLRWWNLEAKRIETATAPAVPVSVDAPPAPPPDTLDALAGFPWIRAGAGLAGLVVLALLVRLAWPRIAALRGRMHARRLAGEPWARRRLLDAVARRDHPAVLRAVETWADRLPPAARGAPLDAVRAALRTIGAARYGRRPVPPPPEAWDRLAAAIRHAAAAGRAPPPAAAALPPLNPVHAS